MISDIQKDVIVSSINSVSLNEEWLNVPVKLDDIEKTVYILKVNLNMWLMFI